MRRGGEPACLPLPMGFVHTSAEGSARPLGCPDVGHALRTPARQTGSTERTNRTFAGFYCSCI